MLPQRPLHLRQHPQPPRQRLVARVEAYVAQRPAGLLRHRGRAGVPPQSSLHLGQQPQPPRLGAAAIDTAAHVAEHPAGLLRDHS